MNAPAVTTDAKDRPLAFVHIGDLHLTRAGERNYVDLLAIVAQIEMECTDAIDFVVLPGDNADNGLPAQYALAAIALKMLGKPVHAIPGDHDMEPGGLDAFYAGLNADPLPRSLRVRGVRCLFLDVCGSGSGGPDFRIGHKQMSWIERELEDAHRRGETAVVFMHAYPADLKGAGETETLNALLASHDVALVDMGHTHYNELANDGRTIFAATRSTGQIEEGPVGYTVATLDDGVVSWRFKTLDEAFPFVMITSPADHRLIRRSAQRVDESADVRAIVLGNRPIKSVACKIGEGSWAPMVCAADERIWTARMPIPADRLASLTVKADDVDGCPGQHTISIATSAYDLPTRTADGSDASRIEVWPENGIFGTQLGPNRNGRRRS